MTDNSPEAILKRRIQDTLIIVGTDIILFSIWTMVKTVGISMMYRTEIIRDMRSFGGTENSTLSDSTLFLLFLIMILFLFSILLFLRLYVGLAAISEGRGRRRSNLYLAIAGIMIVLSILSLYQMLLQLFSGAEIEHAPYYLSDDPSISSVIIELTSIVMMLQMVSAAIRIRRLRKNENREKD